MRKIFLPLLLLVLMLPANALCQDMPFNLSLKKQYTKTPTISGFRHWFGSVKSGEIIFLGKENTDGFSLELQLSFKQNALEEVVLILGPEGIDNTDCRRQYAKVTRALNKKYKHYQYKLIEKDPISDDLVSTSPCHRIRLGLHKTITVWKLNEFDIHAELLGDDDGFYIEIVYKKHKNKSTQKLQKIL